ncbi:hypothetical protein SG34_030305 [Thalassomonas viridans]|uniref:Uncharacterized protein n=1 Tax=Thalassomonas viridans TaxID=137584 RepID=A0AAE9ZEH0_9GAMM|nr:hypothetical protein [Thalassomonas viridans]WDE09068.1 hypothetical protein SG34_030305 [Thalassomonas viridans]
MSEHNPSPENEATGDKTDETSCEHMELEASTEDFETEDLEADEETSLGHEVLHLCDDFARFSDECAFLCDAYAAVVSEPACIGEMTASGLGLSSYKLKKQVEDFYYRIANIHARWQKEIGY